MADAIQQSSLNLANYTASDVWSKNIRSGALARLAAADPEIKVGPTDIFTFTGTPKAELVAEGANKSNSNETPTKVTANTYKVQITYRYTQEVRLLDEEGKIRIINALVARMLVALSRSLDLIAIHGINPLTGTVASTVTNYLDKASFVDTVTIGTGGANGALTSAVKTLIDNGYQPTGIAMDPSYAYDLSQATDANKRPLYPELGLGLVADNFKGLLAASSDTISGKNDLATPANALDRAVLADFNAFKWGIAAEMPMRTIEYGDPDGNGDLQRTNEVAIRAETFIGFAFLDPKAFVLIKAAAA